MTWTPNDVIVTTTHENPTVMREMEALHIQGVTVHLLDPTSPEDFVDQLGQLVRTKRVRAILLSHVSHIDGRMFPLEPISKLAQTHAITLIIDGAQAVGHIPVNLQTIAPDAYFFPGHKWCEGPMGTGALIMKKEFQKKIEGEKTQTHTEVHQPWMDFELGTQNLALIAGLAKACQIKHQEGLHTETLQSYRVTMKEALAPLPQIQFLEWRGPHSPGILSLKFDSTQKDTSCIYPGTESESIAWKTFSLPDQPQEKGIRLSWSSNTRRNDLELATAYLHCLE